MPAFFVKFMVLILLLSTLCSAVSFLFSQTYKGVIRHSTFVEAGRIGLASLLKAIGLFPAVFFIGDTQYTIPFCYSRYGCFHYFLHAGFSEGGFDKRL
jgi:hypothetical protein